MSVRDRASALFTTIARAAAALVVLSAIPAISVAQPCTPEWSDKFRASGIEIGPIWCSVVHDDGTGPALYLGGSFQTIDGKQVGGIVKWDGTKFSPLGKGIDGYGTVRALASVSLGGQPVQLVVGGSFSSAINPNGSQVFSRSLIRWTGSQWQTVPGEFNSIGDFYYDPGVAALLVADVGTGPRLYVGGGFEERVAWTDDLVTFTRLEAGDLPYTEAALALAAFDSDGPGPLPNRIYVGGRFGGLGVIDEFGVGSILPGAGSTGELGALAVFDNDGPGPQLPRLFVPFDGAFKTWNSVDGWSNFSPLATGGRIDALTVANIGAGPRLFIGGEFDATPPTGQPQEPFSRVMQWDGTTLSPLGSGLQLPNGADSGSDGNRRVLTISSSTLRGQPALFVGGTGFTGAGGKPTYNMGFWGGSAWLSQYTDRVEGLPQSALGVFSIDTDAAGPIPKRLIAIAGDTTALGDDFYSGRVAQWTSSGWQTPSPAFPVPPEFGTVSFIEYDDGTGAALYAWGNVPSSPGPLSPRLAKFVGGTWQVMPFNFGPGILNSAAVYYPDGTGSPGILVLAGNSTGFVTTTFPNIIGFNGTSFVQIGGGFPDIPPAGTFGAFDLSVFSVAVHQGKLYASGLLSDPRLTPRHVVARFDGATLGTSTWTPVASHTGLFGTAVRASLAVADFGTGSKLYLMGELFYPINGVQHNGIAEWNGTTFQSLGTGLSSVTSFTPNAQSVAAFDDGSGTKLYVSGFFDRAGGVPAAGLARWNGAAWSAVSGGQFLSSGGGLFVHDDDGTGPSRPSLYVRSSVTLPVGQYSVGLARYGCPSVVCRADFNLDGSPNIDDIFIYLNAWFAVNPRCDVSGDGVVNIDDIFIFLNIWFAGC